MQTFVGRLQLVNSDSVHRFSEHVQLTSVKKIDSIYQFHTHVNPILNVHCISIEAC